MITSGIFYHLLLLAAVINAQQKLCTPNAFPQLQRQGKCASTAGLEELCTRGNLEISISKDCSEFDGNWCCYNPALLTTTKVAVPVTPVSAMIATPIESRMSFDFLKGNQKVHNYYGDEEHDDGDQSYNRNSRSRLYSRDRYREQDDSYDQHSYENRYRSYRNRDYGYDYNRDSYGYGDGDRSSNQNREYGYNRDVYRLRHANYQTDENPDHNSYGKIYTTTPYSIAQNYSKKAENHNYVNQYRSRVNYAREVDSNTYTTKASTVMAKPYFKLVSHKSDSQTYENRDRYQRTSTTSAPYLSNKGYTKAENRKVSQEVVKKYSVKDRVHVDRYAKESTTTPKMTSTRKIYYPNKSQNSYRQRYEDSDWNDSYDRFDRDGYYSY